MKDSHVVYEDMSTLIHPLQITRCVENGSTHAQKINVRISRDRYSEPGNWWVLMNAVMNLRVA
jgi:hypothetical protein